MLVFVIFIYSFYLLFFYKLLLNNFRLILRNNRVLIVSTICIVNSGCDRHLRVLALPRLQDYFILVLLELRRISLNFYWLINWDFRPIYLLAFIYHHFGFGFLFCHYFRFKIFEIVVIFWRGFIFWLFSANLLFYCDLCLYLDFFFE